jgi:hypothetical protein
MDALTVAKKINSKIIELDELKVSLEALAMEKARTSSLYEANLAKSILSLKQENPVTIVEKLARGVCAADKFSMDFSESKYKNQLKIIDLTEAQLNGYQSINRYLSED